MSERQDSLWISDIKEAIKRVEEYTKNISYPEFLGDRKTQDAVVRNVEIMGEAAKKISADFKREHKDIDWKAIAVRDVSKQVQEGTKFLSAKPQSLHPNEEVV